MRDYKAGILAFLIVLFLMPIGHAMMVLTEKIFNSNKFYTAFGIGLVGVILLIVGIFKNQKKAISTILGLLSGILIWTGWVEFSFVWVAEKLSISPLIENGEIITKPEYLVMMSSIGMLSCMLLFFILSPSKCQFFVWIQKILKIQLDIKANSTNVQKLNAVTVFIETIILLWTFYIVLLFLYDETLIGDKHIITQLAAVAFLIWSIYLFFKLIHINKFDYSIRYAVPTVIIFWNTIEILGRWNLFQEVWIHPFEYFIFNISLFIGLLTMLGYYFYKNFKSSKLNN